MADSPHSTLLGKIAAYTEILTTDPRSTIFVSLSETYRKMGMLDDAYSVAIKGLDHLSDYCPGHVVLARIECQQGDLKSSESSFEKALEIDPESLAALVGFSRLYLLQGRKTDARKLLIKARDLTPADPVINKLLLSLPEAEEPSLPVINPVVAPPVSQLKPVALSTPEPLESATLAELYLEQGLADKALDIFHNLLARDPDNLELRRRIRNLESSTLGINDNLAVSPEQSEKDADSSGANAGIAPETVSPVQEPTDIQVEPKKDMSALAQLNRLLTSIQKRRGDV